jgi:uncharacterized protein (DUF2147 family)
MAQPRNGLRLTEMTTIRTKIMAAGVALLALSGFADVPASAQVGNTGNPVGVWLTEGGHGVIRIQPCEQGLCGTIVGIDRKPGDPMPTDHAGHPQCGLTILKTSADIRSGISMGQITDPRDGKTYSAQLWVDGTGKLHLRGYIGVPLLGKTQVWRPFTGQLSEDCRFM